LASRHYFFGYALTPLTNNNHQHLFFDTKQTQQPAHFCRNNFASACGASDQNQTVKFAKGTTTLAFKFNGGIIVSVDSRSTMGAYIASGTVKKVIEINPFLLGTMAGGAADCS
jgi:20S proteasome subunit beta 5